jgi:hypothetical protein
LRPKRPATQLTEGRADQRLNWLASKLSFIEWLRFSYQHLVMKELESSPLVFRKGSFLIVLPHLAVEDERSQETILGQGYYQASSS